MVSYLQRKQTHLLFCPASRSIKRDECKSDRIEFLWIMRPMMLCHVFSWVLLRRKLKYVLLHSAQSKNPCDFWQDPKAIIANCILWLFMNRNSFLWADWLKCSTPLAPSPLVNSVLSRCKLVMLQAYSSFQACITFAGMFFGSSTSLSDALARMIVWENVMALSVLTNREYQSALWKPN